MTPPGPPTYADVERAIRRHHFAVLSTADSAGRPASAGITYATSQSASVLYVMTRRHLQKARNITSNPHVSLVVPLPRLLLRPVPPATIQLRGRAEILDWTDSEGQALFAGFWLGRQIITSYRRLHDRGESRICFLRIECDPVIHTYLLGTSRFGTVLRVRSDMEAGAATITRP